MIRSSIFLRLLHSQKKRNFCSKSEAPLASESSKRPTTAPFDSLGYELINTSTEPQAVQRAVIDSIGTTSFTVSGVRVYGSVIIMPFFSTVWNVDSIHQVSPSSFALVKLIVPRPDIMLVGTGAVSLPLSADVMKFFKDIRVNVEAMDTKNACHTFNVLNQEDRSVAAALFPIAYNENETDK
ncbi:unnamed protein product [Agarophyton chilense]